MSKYRRIEINAYHRRVTVVSGEWRPDDVFVAQTAQTDEVISLDDSDLCEPIEPTSPEGQLILIEAVRSLEQRLSPEARALMYAGKIKPVSTSLPHDGLYFKLQSLYQLVVLKFFAHRSKEK